MIQNRQIEDATLSNDTALPNGASTTVTSAVIDLDAFSKTNPPSGVRQANVEPSAFVPALSTAILPDTKTMTTTIETSDDAAFGSGIRTIAGPVVQTGAAGAGAPLILLQTRLPGDCSRYVRAKVVSGANTTDASALKVHFALKF